MRYKEWLASKRTTGGRQRQICFNLKCSAGECMRAEEELRPGPDFDQPRITTRQKKAKNETANNIPVRLQP